MTNLPDIYFLPEWNEIYQEHDKGKTHIFEYKNELGHIYYQFITRNDPNILESIDYYDIATTYGFSGPIIVECELNNKADLIKDYDKAFNQYCLDNNIVTEFVRFSPWLKNHLDFESIYTTKYINHTIFIDLAVNDFFLDEFNSDARNKIRKSIKRGVKIEFDFIGETVDEFHRLYQIMAIKNKVSEYHMFDLEFLRNTFNYLKGKQFIINAKHENQTISSAIFINHGDLLHYHFSANDPQYYHLHANSLILYEASLWGKNNHKKQLHLGNAGYKELYAFKEQFTKNGICDFYVGNKIQNIKVYNKLVDKRLKEGKIENMSYFPLYRG